MGQGDESGRPVSSSRAALGKKLADRWGPLVRFSEPNRYGFLLPGATGTKRERDLGGWRRRGGSPAVAGSGGEGAGWLWCAVGCCWRTCGLRGGPVQRGQVMAVGRGLGRSSPFLPGLMALG
jgi:hypothetical protein